MQPYPPSPSQNGPILSGTGWGGLFIIAVLLFVLLPALLAPHSAGSRHTGFTPAYAPVEQTQAIPGDRLNAKRGRQGVDRLALYK